MVWWLSGRRAMMMRSSAVMLVVGVVFLTTAVRAEDLGDVSRVGGGRRVCSRRAWRERGRRPCGCFDVASRLPLERLCQRLLPKSQREV